MVSSISRSCFRLSLSAAAAGLLWLAALVPGFAQSEPQLIRPLPNIATSASADTIDLNVTPFFVAANAPGTVVRITLAGGGLPSDSHVDVALSDSATPVTVANFLSYVRAGAYRNSFFHRSGSAEPLGIVQGGGFKIADDYSGLSNLTLGQIPAATSIVNESSTTRPNTRGTIAMARTTAVDSATTQWFFNTDDNTTSLGGPDAGGYTVFGNVVGNGMTVLDQIYALTPADVRDRIDSSIDGAFSELPLLNPIASGTDLVTIPRTDIVVVQSTEVIPSLTFQAQSDDNNIAQISNITPEGVVTVAPGTTSGTANITVTATDLDNVSTSGTFAFVVNGPNTTLISTATTSLTVSGSAGLAAVHVVRSGTAPVTVHYATVAGSAQPGIDYTGTSGNLIFTATGPNDKLISIPIPAHTVASPGKTFNIELSLTPTAGVALGVPTATTVTIVNPAPNPNGALQFSQPEYQVDAGDNFVVVSVIRTGGTSGTVTAVAGWQDDDAANGFDYTGVTRSVTFLPGETLPKPLLIPIRVTGLSSGVRSFHVILTQPTGGAQLGDNASATVTINEKAPLGGVIGFLFPEVRSSGTSATILVQRLGSSSTTASVYFSTTNGTAIAGTHYTAASSMLYFSAGESMKTLNVPLIATTDTVDRTVNLRLSFPSANAAVGAAGGAATLIIARSSTTQVISFDSASYAGVAGRSAAITLSRTGSNAQGVSAFVQMFDVTAGYSSDYATSTPVAALKQVDFAPGSSTASFTVSFASETTRKFFMMRILAATPGASIGRRDAASVDILEGVEFSPASYRVSPDIGQAVIGVVRTGSTAISVDYSTVSNGTALAGTDFTAVNGTLNFADGETFKTFTVPILPVTQSTERFLSIHLSTSSQALITGSDASLVIDHDSQTSLIQFTAAKFAVKSGGTMDVGLTRSGDISQSASVKLAFEDGSAIHNQHFGVLDSNNQLTARVLTLSFDAGSATANVSVVTANVNALLTFRMKLLSASNGALGPISTADASITPDLFQFSPRSSRVSVTGSQAFVTVVRSGSAAGESVTYSTVDGTALAGTDFQSTNGTLTFGLNELAKTIAIPILTSTSLTDTAFGVHLSALPSGAAAAGDATVTVAHDPAAQVVEFQSADVSMNPGGTQSVVLTRSGATDQPLTVTVRLEDDTAVVDTDYAVTNASGELVDATFAAGDSTVSLSVSTTDHATGKDFHLKLLNAGEGAGVGPRNAVTVSVQSAFHFTAASYPVMESTDQVMLTVERPTAGSSETVQFATADGSAVSAVDYTPTSGTLTFATGVFRQSIPVTLLSTSSPDTRQFTVGLSAPVGDSVLGAVSTATVEICKTPANGTVSLSASSYLFDSKQGGTITLIRSGTGQALTVALDILDGTARAALGEYSVSSSVVTFADTATTATLSVTGSLSASKNFIVRLRGVEDATAGQWAVSTPSEATVTLVPNGLVTLVSPTYRLMESNLDAVITVTRSATNVQVLVPFSTANGTAIAGTDYVTASGTLTFNPGVRRQDIHVTLKTTSSNTERTFTVTLGSPTNGAVLGSPSQATVTIVKNPAAGMFGFQYSSYSLAAETFGYSSGVLILRSATSQAATVNVALIDNSAVLDRDYVAYDAGNQRYLWGQRIVPLSFAAGEAYQYLRLSGSVNSPQALTIQLVDTTAGSGITTPNSATVNLIGGGPAGLIQIASADYRFAQSSGTATVAVTRSGSTGTVGVTYATTNGSALAGSHYVATSGTLTFAPGETLKTISVPLVLAGGVDRYFNVQLLAGIGGAGLGINTQTTVNIVANATGGTYSLSQGSYAFGTGQWVPVTVVRSATGQAASVTLALLDDSGKLNQNYVTSNSVSGNQVQLNFDAAQTTGTLTLGAYAASGNTSMRVQLAAVPNNASIGTPSVAPVRFIDGSHPKGVLSFDSGTGRFADNAGAASVTILRTGSGTEPVSVVCSTANGTAIAGTNYTSISQTVTFQANETRKTISLPLIARTAAIAPEVSFTVALSNPSGGAELGLNPTETITIVKNASAGVFSFAAASTRLNTGLPSKTITILRSGSAAALARTGTAYVQLGDGFDKFGFVSGSSLLSTKAIAVSFVANQGSATFEIGAFSGLGDFMASLRLYDAPAPAAVGSPNVEALSFVDNSRPEGLIEFLQTSWRANEAAGIVWLTVSRSGIDREVTVHYATANGSAIAGTDYIAASGDLTFSPGIQTCSFPVRIVNDTKAQSTSRTFSVALSNATGGAAIGQAGTASVSIVQDESTQGVYQFESASYSVNQNAGWAELNITRSVTTKAGDVGVATSDASSGPGRNVLYRWNSPAVNPLIIAHFEIGQDRQKVFIPLIDGVLTGGTTGSFVAFLVSGTSSTLGFQNSTAVNVFSGLQPLQPVVELDSTQYRANDTDGTVIVRGKRYGSASAALTVPFQLIASTAKLGSDFTLAASANVTLTGALSGYLTFPAGVTTASLPLGIKHSTTTTAEKRFTVQLGLPGSGALLLGQTSATVSIANSDASRGLFVFDRSAYRFDQDCGTATLALVRKGTATQLSGSAQITVVTVDGSAAGAVYDSTGKFTGYRNYGYNRQVIRFGPGETSKPFTFQVLNGTVSTASATMMARIESAVNGARAGGLDRTVVTLVNPAKSGLTAFEFDKPSYRINENAGTLSVTVRRVDVTGSAGTSTHRLTVAYSTVNGTAISGVDYRPVSGTLTFAAGVTTAKLTIPILNRSLATKRAFSLRLTTPRDLTLPSRVISLMTNTPVSVEIRGARSPYGLVQFDKGAYSVAANASSVAVTLVRTGVITSPATVQVRSSGGTASSGLDFGGFDQNFTFAAGQSRVNLMVPIYNAHAGVNRFFAAQLFPTTKGATGALDSSVVTILPR